MGRMNEPGPAGAAVALPELPALPETVHSRWQDLHAVALDSLPPIAYEERADDEVIAPEEAAAAPNLSGALADVTVMMVAEDSLITDASRSALEEAGYTRFVAVNEPRLALDMMRLHRPGLLLIDLMLPGLAGFDILDQMRGDAVLRNLPVIVLSEAGDAAGKRKALDFGASEFLAKPVDASELKLRVRNALVFKVYQERLANDDLLTGLPNRRVFVETLRAALDQARAGEHRLALLHINLDRFGQINDALGHAFGDRLLAAVAERLLACTRRDGGAARSRRADALQLSRLGSDEFAVLIPRINGPDAAARVSRQILNAMAKPFVIDGQDLFITPSIGVAVFPEDGRDDEALLGNAGAATAHAKGSGRNNFHYHSAELNSVSLERLLLETQLRRVIARDELVLHYQPRIDLQSRCVVGAEALLRWQHPELGLVPPGRFIPIAEETGLMGAMGEWVVNTACAQIALWRGAGLGEIKVAVNVTRHGLMSGALAKVVAEAIARHAVEPGQLVLELTEGMLMDHVDHTRRLLLGLRALGVELSIDDFGTGHSSISCLKQFPVQELKIDRSFVAGMPEHSADVAIVRALVVLGHSLNMRVVAEGVETEGQRALLEELGCDGFQGFLVSPAVTADEFQATCWRINSR